MTEPLLTKGWPDYFCTSYVHSRHKLSFCIEQSKYIFFTSFQVTFNLKPYWCTHSIQTLNNIELQSITKSQKFVLNLPNTSRNLSIGPFFWLSQCIARDKSKCSAQSKCFPWLLCTTCSMLGLGKRVHSLCKDHNWHYLYFSATTVVYRNPIQILK